MKIVINGTYGGFGLSAIAREKLGVSAFEDFDGDRNNAELVAVVEELGELANGEYAELRVVEIPNESTDFFVDEYDGLESVIYVLNGKIHFAH